MLTWLAELPNDALLAGLPSTFIVLKYLLEVHVRILSELLQPVLGGTLKVKHPRGCPLTKF
jgi:hypothetical protein